MEGRGEVEGAVYSSPDDAALYSVDEAVQAASMDWVQGWLGDVPPKRVRRVER